MNQLNQGESSGGLPLKRRRGRPRKDPSSKHAEAAHPPAPGFEGVRDYQPPQRSEGREGPDPMVGQTVTGVVESTFDAGYLLNVRIGSSTSNLRGLVFKPGYFMPVTAENDVAPHLQMIGRNDIRAPVSNQGWSPGQGLAIQPVGPRPQKRKYRRKAAAPSVTPPVGVRGTLVPVVLEPVHRVPASNQMPPNAPQTGQLMAFGDKDVHMVEPLAMLPPDQSIPVGQIFLGTQPLSHHQASVQNEQLNEVTIEFGQGEKIEEPMESTETDNTDLSETSDTQIDSGKEAVAEDSGVVWKQETGNSEEAPFSTELLPTDSAPKPLFNYGTGRMTELLQVKQK